uniref:holo-[acyl-carrier-protein] synthase n=1 Tax=Paramormyrops kingsleyae TaxID=1676925 RepID=A0A3B3RF61_9TELE
MESARWAFRCGSWTPSSGQWLFAARCIQREEKERIGRFMFARDAKFAMVRAGFCPAFRVVYLLKQFRSVVIAIFLFFGVPGSGSVPHFFHIMRRQFTDHEWAVIQGAGSEWTQLDMFYRHWVTMVTSDHHTLPYTCHKILPHIIGNWVSRLLLLSGSLMANGTLCEAGRKKAFWTSSCRCCHVRGEIPKLKGRLTVGAYGISPPQQFTLLTFDDLISGAVPLADEDVQYWEDFQKKVDAPPQPCTERLL